MPQMAPLNWLLLFNIFIMTFLMFNILNYFNFMTLPKMNLQNKFMVKLTWKW
uniref:ATP synthase complex subunit 8 n=1 Tax=Curculionoidea sp. 25 KM-2017 TaxID=2219409 RepID=A0A346RIA6_9CUCU|nr:ATP synthase F0 subunit 8 [Curculionoidea sp. 25 KM-2017]